MKFIDDISEKIGNLVQKSANKEVDENSFWADRKKRMGLLGLIVVGGLYMFADLMPDSKPVQRNRIQFTDTDMELDQKGRPTTVFSNKGAVKLSDMRSEDLMSTLQEELRDREHYLTAREAEIQRSQDIQAREMSDLRLELRRIQRETEIKLKQMDGIAASNSERSNHNNNAAELESQVGIDAMTASTNDAPQGRPRHVPPRNQSSQYDNVLSTPEQSVAAGHVQAGIRIMNSNVDSRVATGQILRMNNSLENQKSRDRSQVFADLADAKAELLTRQENQRATREEEARQAVEAEDKQRNIVHLPAGTIISGTLINGMQVPTGSSSSNNPMPALMRVKREAILPNYFSSDEVRECVIIASSRPVIEASRVVFRAEHISCLRDDGRHVESRLTAISSGRDGQIGVPATLVSRNGELLAKTAVAGFLEGLTDVLSKTSIEVNSDDGVFAISGNDLRNLTGSAAIAGAGDALDRLAQYYMDLADKMQPTLQVLPGISVDFNVTSLSTLDFNEEGS
ncbi:TraB/VirB10 family protein [Photobacterium sp. ZSDE20]|uniref:TraB/VirB10 family protein n=1 Tax=Photobacterium pectinilyticum TaxID=2906793 RepID=A0ABT1N0X5_9GAMM|nr:TraB/VirB10 family protein [Photobacterium sp. ZSDE20]MCQ1058398.1 TraB/VirB10 family protein [Photobacterium sp. ZSDE20]MDD1825239.1 TraB/VirB10 family protein [Photobacterium sp. ZSDE20]